MTLDPSIVTRFAPSPTGFLHIGSARTALFNWLYARHHGGRFLLRIEDTDRARSTDEAIEAILFGMTWLGLTWDDEPIYQHHLAERHRAVAQLLLESGHAYKCYATAEELTEMREKARTEGRSVGYDGRWRDRDPSEAPADVPPVVRFKAPKSGETVIDDQVQGKVTFPNEQLDDMVLLRSDGTPTYMLSVIVDDHDMGVTHIIRGDDHLNNAARQVQVFHALDWHVPVYAHIPLIHGQDGGKLSKRHGSLGVEAYRDMGMLPEAMCNYLLRLGWSHGDDEIISSEQAIEWFDLPGIGRSAAQFDMDKLTNLNGIYIRNADDHRLLKLIEPEFENSLDQQMHERCLAAMPLLKERAKTLPELAAGFDFLLAQRPLKPDAKAEKLLKPEAVAILDKLIPVLAACDDWTKENAEATVRQFAIDEGLKLGNIAQPLRAALTGTTASPGIFDVLAILGRDESLGRIGDVTG